MPLDGGSLSPYLGIVIGLAEPVAAITDSRGASSKLQDRCNNDEQTYLVVGVWGS